MDVIDVCNLSNVIIVIIECFDKVMIIFKYKFSIFIIDLMFIY